MIVCQCNAISDKTIKSCLEGTDGKARTSAVYKSCSGGRDADCCSCIPHVKQMVRDHNARVEVDELNRALPAPARIPA